MNSQNNITNKPCENSSSAVETFTGNDIHVELDPALAQQHLPGQHPTEVVERDLDVSVRQDSPLGGGTPSNFGGSSQQQQQQQQQAEPYAPAGMRESLLDCELEGFELH